MKVLSCTMVALIVFAAALPVGAANIEKRVSAGSSFDDFSFPVKIEDYFTVCLTGEWSGVVTLERSPDGGFSWNTYRTFDKYYCKEIQSPGWAVWRIGVKAGDLKSGEVHILMRK